MNLLKTVVKSILPEKHLMHLQALDHYFNGEDEIRLMRKLCARGKSAIDAGANIGTYSYFFLKYANRVYAYEPNPSLAKRLTRILPEVQVRNLALSDASGEVVLKVPLDATGHEQHELASIAQDFDGPVTDFSVRAITLDSENLSNVGLIKVDVEQHERQVLKGAIETIRRNRPIIMSEISPLKYEADLCTVFAFLLNENYVGWFKFSKKWYSFDQLKPEVHIQPSNFGIEDSFIGNNVLFFPTEHALSKMGPRL